MGVELAPAARQSAADLETSAALAEQAGAVVTPSLTAPPARPSIGQRAQQMLASTDKTDATPSCQQSLSLSFFFDGTGNNRDADIGTHEHSNVARMFLAHKPDNESNGQYALYIPGIGTYFKEINDPGGTPTGMGFGAEGDKRLQWAFDQFDEKLKYHVSLANNPSNKITMIRVAAFGFSRGATLARAFAVRFQTLCQQAGAGWCLKAGGYPVRFYFLGLWDTVASVGAPMSMNNTPLTQGLGWTSTESTLKGRSMSDIGAGKLAFGAPGADPAPGPANGHMGWADQLDIAPMVEKCVHMVAAHERRNSFPLDSCRRDRRYPDSVEEMVYPGVHSDVGGGYRPGEGARSDKPGQMLSLIPLRVMHQKAWEAGVPLYLLNANPDPKVGQYFATDEASQPEFTQMLALWQHYMSQAGLGGKGIGEMFNAHGRLYFAWRFYKIRLNRAARAAQQDTGDAATLKEREAAWREEKKGLEAEMKPAKADMDAAQRRLQLANNRLNEARANQQAYGQPVDPELVAAQSRAQAAAAQPTDNYLKLQARYQTLPQVQGEYARNQMIYDEQLMADAQAIHTRHLADTRQPLRPHYRGLLEAYVAEFVNEQGLRDEKIIAFFDNYVHDSLVGFARDATLPSDPRVIYLGGDLKSRHSMNAVPATERSPVAA